MVKKGKKRDSLLRNNTISICRKMAISFIASFLIGFSVGVVGAIMHLEPYFVGVSSGTISGAVVVLIFSDFERK